MREEHRPARAQRTLHQKKKYMKNLPGTETPIVGQISKVHRTFSEKVPLGPARVIIHPAQSSFYNMAVDEALLRLCQMPVLRFYRWSEPAVSIGYFQSHTLVPAGRPFVRRYTGGGLVDHAADFTYSLIIPKEHPLYVAGTARSYETIHHAIMRGLQDAGVVAELAEMNAEREHPACFQKPVKFDILADGNKLAGAAQRRTREACLHQGSILVSNISFEKLVQFLKPFLLQTLEAISREDQLSSKEINRALMLEKERYSTFEWNQWK